MPFPPAFIDEVIARNPIEDVVGQYISMAVTAALLSSCGGAKTTTAEADKFDYTVEQFA